MKDQQTEIVRFIVYTKACLKACAKSSENAVNIVEKVMDAILEDAGRISSMSGTTLSAVKETRDLVATKKSADAGKPVGEIVALLQRLASEHKEIDSFTMPIIQALQFQDRTRQQMENLIKIVTNWSDRREHITPESDLKTELIAFGTEIIKMTTTDEERDAIRAVIPGLPEEQKIEAGDDYF